MLLFVLDFNKKQTQMGYYTETQHTEKIPKSITHKQIKQPRTAMISKSCKLNFIHNRFSESFDDIIFLVSCR